jgi:transaldolase
LADGSAAAVFGPRLSHLRLPLEGGADDARRFLEDLREAGVDYEDVVEVLEKEGVKKFADSFEELVEEIKSTGRQLVR